MYACVLIPRSLNLVLTEHHDPAHKGKIAGVSGSIWSKELLRPGTILMPTKGQLIIEKMEITPVLPMNDVRRQFGAYDNSYMACADLLRHCNWVSFVKASDDIEDANVIGSVLMGRPFFVVTKPIRRNDELVVLFSDVMLTSSRDAASPEDMTHAPILDLSHNFLREVVTAGSLAYLRSSHCSPSTLSYQFQQQEYSRSSQYSPSLQRSQQECPFGSPFGPSAQRNHPLHEREYERSLQYRSFVCSLQREYQRSSEYSSSVRDQKQDNQLSTEYSHSMRSNQQEHQRSSYYNPSLQSSRLKERGRGRKIKLSGDSSDSGGETEPSGRLVSKTEPQEVHESEKGNNSGYEGGGEEDDKDTMLLKSLVRELSETGGNGDKSCDEGDEGGEENDGMLSRAELSNVGYDGEQEKVVNEEETMVDVEMFSLRVKTPSIPEGRGDYSEALNLTTGRQEDKDVNRRSSDSTHSSPTEDRSMLQKTPELPPSCSVLPPVPSGTPDPQVVLTDLDTQTTRRGRVRKWWYCSTCNKKFDRPSLLTRHVRTHTGEKPHVCDVCSKRFSTSSSLNTHRRIHSGEKPHVCPFCGKRFTASSNLYYHRMTHNKDKPHKCTECTKSFPTPGDLRSHMFVHSGEWPFRCQYCGRGFSKRTNLTNHEKLHTEKAKEKESCKRCGIVFSKNDPNRAANGKCRTCHEQRPSVKESVLRAKSATPKRKTPSRTPVTTPTDFTIDKITERSTSRTSGPSPNTFTTGRLPISPLSLSSPYPPFYGQRPWPLPGAPFLPMTSSASPFFPASPLPASSVMAMMKDVTPLQPYGVLAGNAHSMAMSNFMSPDLLARGGLLPPGQGQSSFSLTPNRVVTDSGWRQ